MAAKSDSTRIPDVSTAAVSDCNITSEQPPNSEVVNPVESVDPFAAFQNRVEKFLDKHTELYDKLVYDFDEKEYERRVLSDNADKPPLEIITGSNIL